MSTAPHTTRRLSVGEAIERVLTEAYKTFRRLYGYETKVDDAEVIEVLRFEIKRRTECALDESIEDDLREDLVDFDVSVPITHHTSQRRVEFRIRVEEKISGAVVSRPITFDDVSKIRGATGVAVAIDEPCPFADVPAVKAPDPLPRWKKSLSL